MTTFRRTEPATLLDGLAAAGAVAAAIVVRLVYLQQIRDFPLFGELVVDAQAYESWAQRIAAGDWIGQGIFYQAPLYPYFLGILESLFGRDLWAVRVAQIVLGSLACGVLYFAARRFAGRAAALLAASMLALYPPAIYFDGLIQKAVLAGFLTTVLLWTLAHLQEERRLGWSVAGGLVLALLSLAWENALLLVLVIPAWLIVADGDRRRAVLLAGGFVLATGLGLSPVALRNRIVGGELTLTTSNAGTNFYIGNHEKASGTYAPLRPGRSDPVTESSDAREIAEETTGRQMSPGEVSRYWFGRAFEFLRTDPLSWSGLMTRKWMMVWHEYEIPDAEDFYVYGRQSPLLGRLAVVWHFGILLPIAAAGMVITWPERRMRVLHLLALTMAVSVATFFVFARYRFPVVSVLMIFAGAALARLAGLLRERRLALAAAGVGAALLALVATRAPLYSAEYRAASESFGHVNVGLALDRMERKEEAMAEYRAAIAIQAANLDARERLAAILAERGEFDEAAAQYDVVLAMEPGRVDARNVYGVVLWRRGQLAEAVAQFDAALNFQPRLMEPHANLCALLLNGEERGTLPPGQSVTGDLIEHCEAALAQAPGNVGVHNNLGVALLRRGRVSEATAHFEAAVRLDPSDRLARTNLGRARAMAGNSTP